MASEMNSIRGTGQKLAEYLLAKDWTADIIVQTILYTGAKNAALVRSNSDFTAVAPLYLRTVAQRCRELADALDDEALRLVEELVEQKP